jgi:hypothetical protein
MGVGSAISVTLWIIFKFILNWSLEVSLPRVIIPGLVFSLLAYLIGHLLGSPKAEA